MVAGVEEGKAGNEPPIGSMGRIRLPRRSEIWKN